MRPQTTIEDPRTFLRSLFDLAVDAVAAERCLPAHLPPPRKGRTFVVATGKAAAAMARVAEDRWPEGAPLSGIAITRYGHGVITSTLKVIEAGHPLPDDNGTEATREILTECSKLGCDDLLLCLLSGGGSALMAAPAPGITLGDKRDITKALLRSGATIAEMNCVRKHLSAIKGGRLAVVAAPAQTVTLMVSDVAGDDPAVIASGPTVPDPTTHAEARSIIDRYQIKLPAPIAAHLDDAARETPKPGDPMFAGNIATVVATADTALDTAARAAQQAGFHVLNLGGAVEGDATAIAHAHAALVKDAQLTGNATAIMSGGELTVTVSGNGRGGPNQEYLLALAMALGLQNGVSALACDTDGIDGSEDNAGAVITPDSLIRAQQMGLDPATHLRDNNSYEFFEALGDLIVTGPTRTNVNDFRVILVNEPLEITP